MVAGVAGGAAGAAGVSAGGRTPGGQQTPERQLSAPSLTSQGAPSGRAVQRQVPRRPDGSGGLGGVEKSQESSEHCDESKQSLGLSQAVCLMTRTSQPPGSREPVVALSAVAAAPPAPDAPTLVEVVASGCGPGAGRQVAMRAQAAMSRAAPMEDRMVFDIVLS